MSIYLLQATGLDRPGLLVDLTRVLEPHGVRILDVGQAVIHSTLSLGLLIDSPDDPQVLRRELEAVGSSAGISVHLTSITLAAYEQWVARQGEPRWIVTLFGPDLVAHHLNRIARILSQYGLNIDQMTRLSGRASLQRPEQHKNVCVEFSARGTPSDALAMRKEFLEAARELNSDIAFQADDVHRRNRRMIAFDMDSTLIQTEVIDELARRHGVVDQVAAITEAAMNGELDFDQSLRRRLALLRGLSQDVMQDIADNLPITHGAERLISTVRSLGYKTAILSGGFTYFGRRLQQLLNIDYVFANELEIKDGVLTGNVIGPIVNGQRKAELLREIADKESIKLQQVIAVGDGANDVPMLNAAGLGIAFHAKPKVRESTEQQISTVGLDGILYMIGVRDREVPVAPGA